MILVSLFIPLLYLVLENAANNIFINVLGTEFIHLASIFRVVIFSLPFMLWSRVNIIFARAMHFEINLFKVVITAAAISYLIYFFISQYNLFSPEFGILSSQITFSLFTSVFVGRQIKVGIESR